MARKKSVRNSDSVTQAATPPATETPAPAPAAETTQPARGWEWEDVNFPSTEGGGVQKRLPVDRLPALARPGQVTTLPDGGAIARIVKVYPSHCLAVDDKGDTHVLLWPDVQLECCLPDLTAPGRDISTPEGRFETAIAMARQCEVLFADFEQLLDAGTVTEELDRGLEEESRQGFQQVIDALWELARSASTVADFPQVFRAAPRTREETVTQKGLRRDPKTE